MFYAIVVVIALILDQMVKYWTVVNIPENTGPEAITAPLIPGFIHLTNYHNRGAAFGFLQNASWARWFFVVLCALFVLVVVYVLLREMITSPAARWAAVIVVAGAIGNCVDRVITGYVVDMLEFDFTIFGRSFPIFNIADMYITLGVIVFCVFMLLEKQSEEGETTAVPAAGPAPETDGGDSARSHVRRPEKPKKAEIVPFPEQKAPEGERDPFVEWQERADAAPEQPGTGTVTYTQPEAARQEAVQPQEPVQAEKQAAEERSSPHARTKTERVMRTLVSGKPVEEEPVPAQPEPAQAQAAEPEPPEAAAAEPAAPTPEPAETAAPEQPHAETETSYNLDDILAEFRDL